MSTQLEALEAEALKLSPTERSHLLALLSASLAAGHGADAEADGVAAANADDVHGRMAMARILSRLPR